LHNFIDQTPDMNIPKWQKIVIYLMIAIAFLTLWASLYVPIYDGDIWFHMLYGKAIVENFTLTPDHTIYSWTPSSNDHIYCAWIGQVFYYLLYKYFGNGGVIVFRYIAASSLFLAILILSRQRNTFYNPITWFTALLCTLLISQTALDKPEIFSFAFMTLIVWNWYKIKQVKQNVLYQIYLFPLVSLIWVNTHGAFVVGCLFLLCVGLGETINQVIYQQNALPRKLYYHLLLALFLSAGATLVTPYGYNYIHQLAIQSFDKQLQSDISHVQAYISTFAYRYVPQIPVFADVAIGIILLVFSCSFRKKQLDFVPIISNLLFAFLFTVYGRFVFPWIVVFSLSIVYYGAAVSVVRINRKAIFIVTFSLASLILSGWFLHHEKKYPIRGQFLQFGISEKFAIDEEIDFLIDNYKNARLANSYDHGAYILWKHWPKIKVMMDARYFPYKNWFNEFQTFSDGGNVEKFIEKYPFDAIVLKHLHYNLILWFYKSKDWQLVFYGKSAAVFVRSSLALSDRITAGVSLNDIKELPIAASALYTSILAKDWPGTEIILNNMKRNFTDQGEKDIISGLTHIKMAGQMYEQKNYSASIDYMEKAYEKRVSYNPLYAAALLMKAIEDWQDQQWGEAIKNTIKSLIIENSFAANYNLAVMGWQLEKMEPNNQAVLLSLEPKEKELVTNWRITLKYLVQNKIKFQQHYGQYVENADKILNDDVNCKTQLVLPDYQ